MLSKLNGNYIFQVSLKGAKMALFFEKMEENKSDWGINEWGFSQSSLEDVYLRIIEMDRKRNRNFAIL